MFYFAWVDPDTAFDPYVHSVEDEKVIAFDLTHTEGEFPQLSIVIQNPRVNLLGIGRKLWLWLSEDGTPIFYGRLVALPQELFADTVKLDFLARPADYADQKETLADTMRVLPYFDPVWLDPQRLADPDTVLESRTLMWHIDRITHAVTVSDIIAGEDGTITLTADDHLYDDLDVEYGDAPLRRVKVNATVAWDQIAQGQLDITNRLLQAFNDAGSPNNKVSSLTGQGLQNDWPELGQNMNGGWAVGPITLDRVDGVQSPQRFKTVKVSNATNAQNPETNPGTTSNATTAGPLLADFFIWEFHATFPIDYDVSRKRVETVTFTLEAAVQSIIVDPGEDETFDLNVSTKAVGEIDPTDPYSEPPIGDLRRRSYMMTDRGHQSLENLILLARAKLISRARTVNITVGTSFETGLAFTCRKNIHVFDPRLPDGEAIGKIIAYTLSANGEGLRRASATLGCSIGTGTAIGSPNVGSPTYCEAVYVGEDYQVFTGGELTLASGDVIYGDYNDTVIGDDGLDLISLAPDTAIVSLTVINGEDDQVAALSTTFQDIPAAINALNADFTEVELVLINMKGGPFQTDFNISVSDLAIAKTIEL